MITVNEQAGRLIIRCGKEANWIAKAATESLRGVVGGKAKLSAADKLEQLSRRCGKMADQIDRRVRG